MKIGFTGLPAIGKTTLLNFIKENFKEKNIIELNETARYVIDLLSDTDLINYKEKFQIAVISSVYVHESTIDNIYKNNNYDIYLCDRIFIDSIIFSSFYNFNIKDLFNIFNFMSNKIIPYDLIINLQISENQKEIDFYTETFFNEIYNFIIKDDGRNKTIGFVSAIDKYKKFIEEFNLYQNYWLTLYKKEKNVEVLNINLMDFYSKDIQNLIDLFKIRNDFIVNLIKEKIIKRGK